MDNEQIERLQDAWFLCRDVQDETGNKELKKIMDQLHTLIDTQMEQMEVAA